MASMQLHLISIFNTVPAQQYSQCAFTGKCLRFAKMMQPFGYQVVEYANEGSESEAAIQVPILRRNHFLRLRRQYEEQFPNQLANVGSEIYQAFHERLIPALKARARPGDIVCHPLGYAHSSLGAVLPKCYHVEPGIGYVGTFFPYKVFESYAWWHYHQGLAKRAGNAYEWVVPMGYDLEEWRPRDEPGDYILYFGRLAEDKGLPIIKEIARHVTDRDILLCGGGDPSRWLDPQLPRLKYHPPVTGRERSELLRYAYCMLMPTTYTEPFGSSGVEGMLCGTPLLASDFGAFSETVRQGVTGYRCKTLGDWLYAIAAAGTLDRKAIATQARAQYDMRRCGMLLDKVFRQVQGLQDQGWYGLEPFMAIPG